MTDIVNDSQCLIIIPCCAKKRDGGGPWQPNLKTFESKISKDVIGQVIAARKQILNAITGVNSHNCDNKLKKNLAIKEGPDFGGRCTSMKGYMPAIDRYSGTLYTVYPKLPSLIRNSIENGNGPNILILSALYGPLHPFDYIQDYNLTMGDRNASRVWSNIFPAFLTAYIKAFNIKRVELYFGAKTAYNRIALKAVSPLIQSGHLQQAILYDVHNGGLRETPRNHGFLLASRLGGNSQEPLTREIRERNIQA